MKPGRLGPKCRIIHDDAYAKVKVACGGAIQPYEKVGGALCYTTIYKLVKVHTNDTWH